MPLPLSKLCSDFDERIAVFHSIDAPIENLTVAELCKRAGISRKRFYTLFEGKEDIFHWFLNLVFEASLYEVGRSLTWEEGIRACLSYIADEKNVFAASYKKGGGPSSRYWALHRERMEEATRTLNMRGISITSKLSLEIDLFSSAVPTLIRYWVEAPESCTIDDYAACWLDCIPDTLKDAMELK